MNVWTPPAEWSSIPTSKGYTEAVRVAVNASKGYVDSIRTAVQSLRAIRERPDSAAPGEEAADREAVGETVESNESPAEDAGKSAPEEGFESWCSLGTEQDKLNNDIRELLGGDALVMQHSDAGSCGTALSATEWAVAAELFRGHKVRMLCYAVLCCAMLASPQFSAASQVLKESSSAILDDLMAQLRSLRFSRGEYVIRTGEKYPGLCVVLQGKAVIEKAMPATSNTNNQLTKRCWFGRVQSHISARSAIMCVEDLVVAILPAVAYAAVVNPTEHSSPQCQIRHLSDINLLHRIGDGSFGEVFACCRGSELANVECEAHALKAINKDKVRKSNAARQLINELTILQLLASSFTPRLLAMFDQPTEVYVLMSLAEGDELFEHLVGKGTLSLPSARFYAANVVLAFEYLHTQLQVSLELEQHILRGLQVIYRDLKPENLVIRRNGYLMLVDYGTSHGRSI